MSEKIVQCSVDAERIGFHGYGMLLAEIGMPPGAEVDRSSLERAMKASGWDINEYDVLPDKLIVYLWPHAGHEVLLTFKPRYGLKALSAPSILYDYYNPEAHATVAPTHSRCSSVERRERILRPSAVLRPRPLLSLSL